MIPKMINYDDVTKKTNQHNPNWPQIPDHSCIIGGCGTGTTNALLNLIK